MASPRATASDASPDGEAPYVEDYVADSPAEPRGFEPFVGEWTSPDPELSYLYSYDSGDLELADEATVPNAREELLEIQRRQAAASASTLTASGPTPLARTASQTLRRRKASEEAADERLLVKLKEVEMFEELGAGAFGSVFRGELWGLPCAVKTFRNLGGTVAQTGSVYHPGWQEEFENEVSALRTLRHPHCVQLLAFSKDPYSIVFEYMDMGSLESLLFDEHTRIHRSHVLHVARCVASGLHYLHTQTPEMLHKDIKSANVLVGDAWRRVKIADFGLSVLRPVSAGEGDHTGSNFVTTVQFRAPEATSKHYTAQCDVYSYGILLSEILNRKPPYAEPILHENGTVYDFSEYAGKGTHGTVGSCKSPPVANDRTVVVGSKTEMLAAIRDPEISLRPALPRTNCPLWLLSLVERCWAHDPNARPTMHDILLEIEVLPSTRGPGATSLRESVPALKRQNSNPLTASGERSFGTASESLAALGQEEPIYVSKLTNNYYCRLYNAVFRTGTERLALVIISKVVAMVQKHAAGAYILHNGDTNQFYGLFLYADDEGLRAADSFASKNQALGDRMTGVCATPLFREVLEATPVGVRSGAKVAHLTRMDVHATQKNSIEAAIQEYQAKVVPNLLELRGWSGLLVATQYNENRVFFFNFFDSTSSLHEFVRQGKLNEVSLVLRDFMAAPVSFETFDVVLQVGAGVSRASVRSSITGASRVGYMHKEGGFIRNFKRRFFILRDHMLYYYESNASQKPLGAVALSGAEVIADPSNTKYFRVQTPRRRWVFFCDTEEDARDWINALLGETTTGA